MGIILSDKIEFDWLYLKHTDFDSIKKMNILNTDVFNNIFTYVDELATINNLRLTSKLIYEKINNFSKKWYTVPNLSFPSILFKRHYYIQSEYINVVQEHYFINLASPNCTLTIKSNGACFIKNAKMCLIKENNNFVFSLKNQSNENDKIRIIDIIKLKETSDKYCFSFNGVLSDCGISKIQKNTFIFTTSL